MKKRHLLFLLCALLSSAKLYAYDVEIDGIYYDLNSETENKWAAVTYGPQPQRYTGNVVIPASITYEGIEYSVKGIGTMAFKDCKDLTSVTIPNSVASIGYYAFAGCKSLTSLTIPDNVGDIGRYAFAECTGLTTFILPKNLIILDSDVFSECSGLTSVTIPYGVREINAAFDQCSRLVSVNIPNSVESIEGSFNGCSSLKSITIPNSVEIIGKNTFSYCTNLTSIVIGKNIKTIKNYAFSDCPNLTDVYCYAETVPDTKSNAFSNSLSKSPTLHVPVASMENYKNVKPWSLFGEFVPLAEDETVIETLNFDNRNAVENIFTIDGTPVETMQKGVNIIKYKDGTSKKVVVK